jgi:hypothetical protein
MLLQPDEQSRELDEYSAAPNNAAQPADALSLT